MPIKPLRGSSGEYCFADSLLNRPTNNPAFIANPTWHTNHSPWIRHANTLHTTLSPDPWSTINGHWIMVFDQFLLIYGFDNLHINDQGTELTAHCSPFIAQRYCGGSLQSDWDWRMHPCANFSFLTYVTWWSYHTQLSCDALWHSFKTFSFFFINNSGVLLFGFF